MAARAAGEGPYGFSFELRSIDAGRPSGGAAPASDGRRAAAPSAVPRAEAKRRREKGGAAWIIWTSRGIATSYYNRGSFAGRGRGVEALYDEAGGSSPPLCPGGRRRAGRRRRQPAGLAVPGQLPRLLPEWPQGRALPFGGERRAAVAAEGRRGEDPGQRNVSRPRGRRLRLGRQLLPHRLHLLRRHRQRPAPERERKGLGALRRRGREPLRPPGRGDLRLLQGPPRARHGLREVPPATGRPAASRARSGTTPATRAATRRTRPWPPGS